MFEPEANQVVRSPANLKIDLLNQLNIIESQGKKNIYIVKACFEK